MIEKELKSVLQLEKFENKAILISDVINSELPLAIQQDQLFEVKSNGEIKGYYYLGTAYGKADYFDFMVIFDMDLLISKVKMLVYREDHGGEIGSKRWLKQFIGSKNDKELQFEKDIVGISGATISARSMTIEINKLLKTMYILNKKQLF